MKKNQIILTIFALVIIISGVLYYQIVDLENGQLIQNNIVQNDEEDKGSNENNNFYELNNELNDKESNVENIKEPTKVVENKITEVSKTPVVSTSGDLSICNENGRIPILMYYKFAETNENGDEWTRTFAEFKNDLKLLYENNYRPISMTDYVNGNINVPYGMTPVILTFDDGHVGQLSFKKDESGNLVAKEKTAVAIMQEFNKQHPDFELKGIFYISSENFFGWTGKNSERLQYLVDLGFEIGNRTNTSYYLGNAKSAEKVQQEVGGLAKFVSDLLPGYKVDSLSLPAGSKSKSYAEYMYEGEYDGFAYENTSVVSIYNSFAARSPIDNEKDLKNLPRIKVSDSKKGLEYWVKYYKEHPEERYISDGNEMTFVINSADENLVTVDSSYEKYVK